MTEKAQAMGPPSVKGQNEHPWEIANLLAEPQRRLLLTKQVTTHWGLS